MTIRDELDAINAGFGEAFATGDAERLAAFYADDARLLFLDPALIDDPDPVAQPFGFLHVVRRVEDAHPLAT